MDYVGQFFVSLFWAAVALAVSIGVVGKDIVGAVSVLRIRGVVVSEAAISSLLDSMEWMFYWAALMTFAFGMLGRLPGTRRKR